METASTPVSRAQQLSRRGFYALGAGASLAVLVFVAWDRLRLGGDMATLAVDDLGQAAAAFVAMTACAWAARHAAEPLRPVWWLFAASAASWGLGEVVWSVYEVGLGVAVPFPSAADAGFLLSVPLAGIAILALPSAPGRATTRVRALLDGGTVAVALLFISWALGLGAVYAASAASPVALTIGLAYPAGDIVIGTLLVLAIGRAPRSHRGRLVLLVCGVAANAVSDSAFAILTANGAYGQLARLLDAGWVAGYLMIALAAVWPDSNGHEASDEGLLGPVQASVPWIALLSAVATAATVRLAGFPLDSFLLVPGGALVVLSAGSQVLYYRDSSALLGKSRRAEAAVREREIVLNEVIDHAPQGVARVDLGLRITNVNPRMRTVLQDIPIVAGAALTDFLPDADVARLFAQFAKHGNGTHDTYEMESLVHSEGRGDVWVHWSATAVRAGDRQISYYVVMLENVDAEHQARLAERAHLDGLERLNRLKSEFIAMVSHEFRTALVGIQGFSELMREQDLPAAEVRNFASEIHHDALRMDRMITEMLDLDQIETGRTSLRLAPVDLNAIVRDAAWKAAFSHPQHAARTALDPDLPHVLADPDRLTQVVTNLLNYAAQHSADGADVVIATEHRGDKAVVTVRDHGFHIPAGDVADGLATAGEDIAGHGLALEVARRIVEMQGGRMWIAPEESGGSQLHFSLPLEPAIDSARA